jgi:replicative DNA helicase
MSQALQNPKNSTATFNLLSSSELDELDCKHTWLVKNVLVANEPGVIGGPKKALKTSVMVDLAISLGTGECFLGRFPVPRQRRVAVFSGESGKATLKGLAQAVCKAKGRRLDDDCLVDWEFRLPQFTVATDRKALRKALCARRIEVVFIDPLYLCLGGRRAISASNLYDVGPALAKMASTCLDAGATPIFIHHATKSAGKARGAHPLDLDDLAFSGIGEFARQWILLNRKEDFWPGSSRHQLLMSIGGSAGHSSCWDVEIENTTAGKSGSRCWKVKVGSTNPRVDDPNCVAKQKINGLYCPQGIEG